jgi:hypothetical protein
MKKQLLFILIVSGIIFNKQIFAQEEIKIEPFSGDIEFVGIPSEPEWNLCRNFPLVMHYPVYKGTPTE